MSVGAGSATSVGRRTRPVRGSGAVANLRQAAERALAAASTASADTGENKNSVTFSINCGEFGTFTGTLPGGNGSALVLENGGIAIRQGVATLGGELIAEPTPGLERQGMLVECRFTFPGQEELLAFVLFAPTR